MARSGLIVFAFAGVAACGAGDVAGGDPTARRDAPPLAYDVARDDAVELFDSPLKDLGPPLGVDAAPRSDARADAPSPDDASALDVAAPDASALDIPAVDVAVPDISAPDVVAPDVPSPDVVAPEDVALPPMPTPRFLVGYNEAWFGDRFSTGLTTAFDLAYVNRTFDGIIAAGGHIVRIFLFELMQGVTLSATPPRTQSLSPAMRSNLDAVLVAARRRGLWVYVTALEGNSMGAAAGPPRDYFVDLLNNRNGEGDAFNSRVLAPLLGVLDAHRDNVWAIDLLNEFEAPRSHGLWSDPLNGPRGWIQRTAAYVHARSPWLRVTSSAGWDTGPNDIGLGLLSGLGLNFYDLHSYNDGGGYAGQTAICNRAAAEGMGVVLGEFGQATHRVDDTLQAYVTGTYLYNAAASCFSAALAWRFDAAETWWAFQRADGSFRPAVSFVQAYGR